MKMNRREDLLRSIGAVGLVALTGCRVLPAEEQPREAGAAVPTSGPGPSTGEQPTEGVVVATGSQPQASHTPSCVLTPQQAEGPFYFDPKQVRRDVTEGRPGASMQLALRVVEAGTCRPIRDALVDIWHADAAGLYSGYGGQGDNRGVDTSGEAFLRGIQITDTDGLVRFASIYPGWYPSRAVHVHFKVRFANQTAVTSQLYFPEEVTDRVYAEAPYNLRGRRARTNQTDILLRGDPEAQNLLAEVSPASAGYRAALTIGIAS